MGTALGPLAAQAVPGAMNAAGGDAHILADRLLQAYPARPSLEAIGAVFWREAAVSPLARQARLPHAIQDLLRHLDLPEADLRRMSPTAIRSRIKAGTARDFSKCRIVQLRGWLLGETEARLCAIAALRTA